MKAEELRQFTVIELKARIGQWQDELFRFQFKTQSSEARDTSILMKLRRDIARGMTVLSEKNRAGQKETEVAQDKGVTREEAEKES